VPRSRLPRCGTVDTRTHVDCLVHPTDGVDQVAAAAYTSNVTDSIVTPTNPIVLPSALREDVDASVSLLTAVADPIRWTVLQQLAASESCVCNLQEHIPIAANLLSYHLKVLRDAGLVTTSRRGRWIDYSLAGDALDRLAAALPGADPVRGAARRAAQ
jgi:ArsR family transcriptional regulator